VIPDGSGPVLDICWGSVSECQKNVSLNSYRQRLKKERRSILSLITTNGRLRPPISLMKVQVEGSMFVQTL